MGDQDYAGLGFVDQQEPRSQSPSLDKGLARGPAVPSFPESPSLQIHMYNAEYVQSASNLYYSVCNGVDTF